MYPIVFHLEHPDLYVRTYWLVVLVGSAVALALAVPRLRTIDGLTPGRLRWVCLLLALGAFAGGRLHHVLNTWSFVRWKLEHGGGLAELVLGGVHSGGVIIGLALSAAVVLRLVRLPALRVADAIAAPIALGMAFGRFACFLNGCCYGTPCSAAWCVRFPMPSNPWDYHRYRGLVPTDATWSAPVHPLQLYLTLAALAVMALALWLERRKRYDGQVALVALLVFAVTSAALEGFRETFVLRRYWMGLPQLTWTALAMAAAALVALAALELQNRRPRRVSQPVPT